MKKLLGLVLILSVIFSQNMTAQSVLDQVNDPFFGETCTSIMVGKKASTDGSVITSHTCDGRYRTWLRWEKAQKFDKSAKCKIYKGLLKTETAWDMRNVKEVGSIKQAKETYAFLNTAYPCLNEKQLAIGETTIVGPKALVNENGMFQIEELERIALQRCSTARGAIKLIGELIKKHGYGDWGECITIADKNEVWQLEIFGQGPKKIGGVWAAQRVPDNHVAISANFSRIAELDLDNKDYFMASDNVFKVAKKLKRWDGKSTFKFWSVYGGNEKPYTIRDFYVLNHFAPSLKLNMDMKELPFSVKPENLVSVQEVIGLFRETYEGTQWDMTKNLTVTKKVYNKDREVIGVDTVKAPNANPWPTGDNRKLYNSLKKGTVEYQRTVAVAWCSYSFITQLRSWLPDEIGGRVFFSFDNPAQSPRIPIYSGSTQLPESFNYCGQKRYREDATIWNFRKANKLATLRWQSTRKGMMEEVAYFENQAFETGEALEKKVATLIKAGKKKEAQVLLNKYTRDFTGAASLRWKELENSYWRRFGLGF
jgi:dipeptidase